MYLHVEMCFKLKNGDCILRYRNAYWILLLNYLHKTLSYFNIY